MPCVVLLRSVRVALVPSELFVSLLSSDSDDFALDLVRMLPSGKKWLAGRGVKQSADGVTW